MQISYGILSSAGTFIEDYLAAHLVTSWTPVVAVKIDALIRSPRPDATYAIDGVCRDSQRTYSIGNLDYIPQDAFPDCFRRRVFTSVIQLRNRIID